MLDVIGAILSFLSTVFFVLASELAWPIGIIATLLNAILYGISGIYGDMSLEIIYFVMMFLGWYQWRTGGEGNKPRPVCHVGWHLIILLLLLVLFGWVIIFQLLKHFTVSNIPSLDAFTTVLSLAAQWLTCFKMIECWLFWFIVDALYIWLYYTKGLPAHSMLLLLYLAMAVIGYWRWLKLMSEGKVDGPNYNS